MPRYYAALNGQETQTGGGGSGGGGGGGGEAGNLVPSKCSANRKLSLDARRWIMI